jgi:hypothetical protein
MHLRLLVFLIALFVFQSLFGQLSKRHYFPPMPAASFNNIISAVPGTPYLYLSTPEIEPVEVTLQIAGGGTSSYFISNTSPVTIPFSSNGYQSPLFVDADEQNINSFGIPLTNKGVWLEADKEIYANLRVNSTNNAQAEMLTSKGSTGIGTLFYTGHLYNTFNFGDRINFVSVMSLSNDNQVTISGLDPDANILNLGTGSTEHTVTLQMHQTLIFASTPYNSPNPFVDGTAFIGRLLSSSEDVVVNVGSTNGNMLIGGNGRDYAFDQIVPVEMVGDEYLLVRGNGTSDHEKPIIIATEPSTNIYFNDNPNPVTLLNQGDYYIVDLQVDSENYFDENGLLALKSSNPIYVYQPVMADPGCCTQGMFFVPPLNCAAPNFIDGVTDISKIGSKSFVGSVNLISRKEAIIDLHNGANIMTFDQNGATGQIPSNVNVNGPFFGTPDGGLEYMVWKISGLSGSVSAFSDYDLYTGVFGYNNVAGWGGFYSGFGQVPEITAVQEPANCIPSVLSASSGFEYYQWFKDDEVIPGAVEMEYEATESGTYYVLAGLVNCPPVVSPNINLSDPDFLLGGDDISACPGSVIQLMANSTENATTYSWTSSGDGFFDNPLIINPVYYPGLSDNESGLVILTVSGNNNGCLDEEQVILSLEDVQDPDALCQSIVVPLDFYGMASIQVEDIDAGSTDNCLLESIWVDPDDCLFNCDDVGDNPIVLEVTDHAGNISFCEGVVTVVDLLPSVAICKDLIIELDALGYANVNAESMNYGSFDNCAIYSITVDENENTFDCNDLGLNFLDLDITDSSFNVTSCESEILIVDLLEPDAHCKDTVLYLDDSGLATLIPEDLDDGSDDNCTIITYDFLDFNGSFDCTDVGIQFVGITVTDQSGNIALCISNVEVIDTILASVETPVDEAIESTFFLNDILPVLSQDTCSVLDAYFGELVSSNNCEMIIDQACDFYLDSCGTGEIVRIWYSGPDNEIILDSQIISIYHIPNWTVTFPPDLEYDCQDTTDIEFGNPELETNGYEVIQISFIDSVGYFNSDACYSIIREWTAINWCTYPDEDPIVHYQIIDFLDTEAPVVFVEDLLIALQPDMCLIDIELPDPVISDCSDSVLLNINHNIPSVGAGPGVYQVNYEVVDLCGNEALAEIEIEVFDNHEPVLDLLSVLNRNINSTGTVQVLARDFDNGSTDNCSSLFFSFSEDPADSLRVYDCDSLGTYQLEIWAWDVSGNQTMDNVELNVEDDFDSCPDFYRIEGVIFTEEDDPVQLVEVGINAVPYLYITDNDGYYSFNVLEETEYVITPFLDTDPLNGVTVYDIILISQHILGINLLDSPYKRIAADADNNQMITTLDILAIRKVILQMESSFPNNTSWRFVEAAYTFPNPEIPWGFPEYIQYDHLESDQPFTNFIGVKIGDVNNSVQANGN